MTLAEMRHSLKLSKAEVSRQSGVSIYTIRKLERGRLNVPLHKMCELMATYRKHGIDILSLDI